MVVVGGGGGCVLENAPGGGEVERQCRCRSFLCRVWAPNAATSVTFEHCVRRS